MKKFISFISLILIASYLSAQTTTVSATVVDSDSITWANGSWGLTFTPNPSNPNPSVYNINGTPLSPSVTTQSGVLDSSGALSFSVYQTTTIAPAGSSWTLKVCPNAVTACGIYNFTAIGSTMNLSSALTSIIPAPRFHAVSGAYGYTDNEATVQLIPGNTYWNVTSLEQRWWTGADWITWNAGVVNTAVSLNTGPTLDSLAITGYMPQTCTDSTEGSNTQACSTAATFVPQTANAIVYQAPTNGGSQTGSLTLAVNGSSAKPLAVPGPTGWTTTFPDGYWFPTTPVLAVDDGTNWDVSGTGRIPGGYLPGFELTTNFSALTYNITGGWVNCNGTMKDISAAVDQVANPDDLTYVFLNISSNCTIGSNDTGFGSNIPLYLITSNLGIISTVDERAMLYAVKTPFITSLTTTGTSGPSTVIAGVLNVPVYNSGSTTATLGSCGTGTPSLSGTASGFKITGIASGTAACTVTFSPSLSVGACTIGSNAVAVNGAYVETPSVSSVLFGANSGTPTFTQIYANCF